MYSESKYRKLILRILLAGLLFGGMALCASGKPDTSFIKDVFILGAPSPTRTFASQANIAQSIKAQSSDWSTRLRFAVIGDFGVGDQNEADVAAMVDGWNPDLIITTGDNNYPDGAADTIDQNIGQFYHQYIFPYTGAYQSSTKENRFFPSLGNHDWITSEGQPYFDYFTLPGNERYYEFTKGPVHFFVLNSVHNADPDGNDADSKQANWLRVRLSSSTSVWKIVYMHHPPYSSGKHGSTDWMQWPFANWGADVVLSGHDHTYERISKDGITYFVNGLGGRSIYDCGEGVEGSQVCYDEDYGAMLIEARDRYLNSKFINVEGVVVDEFGILQHFNLIYLPVVQ
jgi:hypothetical protein